MFTTKDLKGVRQLAVATVLTSVTATIAAGVVLPPVALPLLALTVPFIAAGLLEGAVEHTPAHA